MDNNYCYSSYEIPFTASQLVIKELPLKMESTGFKLWEDVKFVFKSLLFILTKNGRRKF